MPGVSTPIPNRYPVEITPPDITPWAAGNTGVPYVHRLESAVPGPSVMVAAVVHGNEPCGAVALDWLLRTGFTPRRGSITLAFMNHAAYAAFDAADPNATRWLDEDFNRLWGPGRLDTGRPTRERERAREVAALVAETDYLLDIHSFQHPGPPLAMAGWCEKGVALARGTGLPERIVMDRGHAAGMRMRDHCAFGEPELAPAALLLECGQHWAAASADLALAATCRFLCHLGLADEGLAQTLSAPARSLALAPPPPQQVFEVTEAVTIESAEGFRFAEAFTGGEILEKAGTLIGHDGTRPVRTPYDDCLLVMPSMRLWQGQTAVRLARRRN
ncbi:MAG: succinylglutamate desuccinylase/aspartoacylase family protein [Pseudomonadota bacterium]